MECSNCQTNNSQGHLFCRECGVKPDYTCPKCNTEIAPSEKFCGNCGRCLLLKTTPQEPTFEEKLSKIKKYLPGGLIEKILAQKGKIEGERKQVTLLFADMENFTALVKGAELFFNSMADARLKGERVEIQGLCSFHVREYESYTFNRQTVQG